MRRKRNPLSHADRELFGWLVILRGSAVDSGQNRFLHRGPLGQLLIHKERVRGLEHFASAAPSGRVILTARVPAAAARYWKDFQKRRENPARLIPSRWTSCQVMRTARGQVKVKLAGTVRQRSGGR
jgi:hypothetical protein